MYPKIIIDYNRCTVPMDCKKCLQVCPQGIFDVETMKMVRLRETDKKESGAFKLQVFYRDKCSGCTDCVKVCPQQALAITYPGKGGDGGKSR